MLFHKQLRNELLKQEKRKTVYGVLIAPDGRVLVKRGLIKTGLSGKRAWYPGLWHSTLSRQVKELSPETALRTVIFTELGINPEEDPIKIKYVASVDCQEGYIGELLVYSIRFTGPIKLRLSYKTEHKLTHPGDLIKEMYDNPHNFMPEAIATFELLKHNWKEAFVDGVL